MKHKSIVIKWALIVVWATLAPSSTPTATFEVDTESLTLIASSTEE